MTGRDPAPEKPRPTPATSAGTPEQPAPRVRRQAPVRRRIAEPVLPDTTRDEGDLGWGDLPDPDDDERLLREVPPHHGS